MKTRLVAVVNGQRYEWEADSESSLFIEAARKGFQEWLQDAGAKAAGLAHSEKIEKQGERYSQIVAGTYQPGAGGGGGPKLSIEARSARRAFEAIASSVAKKLGTTKAAMVKAHKKNLTDETTLHDALVQAIFGDKEPTHEQLDKVAALAKKEYAAALKIEKEGEPKSTGDEILSGLGI